MEQNTVTITNVALFVEQIKTSVIFKKLEKVGEPYYSKYFGKFYQKYITYIPAVGYNFKVRIEPVEPVSRTEIYVELKQKEDMRENKLGLKPFDIQKAREGKPVCTRDGRKARIICFDFRDVEEICCLIAAVDYGEAEKIYYYDSCGKYRGGDSSKHDLMMLPEKKEGWINIYALNTFYSSKEEAEANIDRDYEDKYIGTIEVEWEE